MTFTGLFQSIFGGIGVGSIYSLLGLSFALIFGRLRICSVLHGDLAILAAYGMYWTFNLLGVSPIITALLLLPVFFILGFFTQATVLKPFMDMPIWKGRYQGQVMVTQGIAIALMAIEIMLFTTTFRIISTSYRNKAIILGTLRLSVVQLISLGSLAILVLVLNHIITKTRLGISIRACSDDRTTAMLTGINYDRICNIAFGLSSSIAVIAGLFYSLTYQINPSLGMELTLKGWMAVIVGGMGSISGIVLAGFIVGLIESLISYFWVPAYKEAVLFIALIIFLVAKPKGLITKQD